jgi:hypothetical protein
MREANREGGAYKSKVNAGQTQEFSKGNLDAPRTFTPIDQQFKLSLEA